MSEPEKVQEPIPLTVVQSDGMGVESVAAKLRWIFEPETRPCPLEQLVVLTAMTGNEHTTTGQLYEQHILPLYRKYGIRYVQVARGGPSVEDGIVVLEDSRCPTRLHIEGVHKLSQELLAAGTVPQVASGKRLCSVKFKGWPLDTWLEREFGPRPLVALPLPPMLEPGSIIYPMTKRERDKLEAGPHIPARHFRHVMGFNADEGFRVERDKSYSTEDRHSEYPLMAWGWSREKCEAYIFEKLGVHWPKSCCKWCPFTQGKDGALDRMIAEGNALEALLLEHVSLALNPKMTLYSSSSLRGKLQARAPEVVAAFEEALHTLPWAVYRVRRVLYAPGRGDREVVTLATGRRAAMLRELMERAPDAMVSGNSLRAWARLRVQGAFPTVEEMLVAAPHVPQDKARDSFPASWAKAVANPGRPPETAQMELLT
jgi:hypothetical protein